MATLPALAAADGLLEEMAYALDTLKLDGVATTTSIDDIYLGDMRYDTWFEEMNRRGVTLFVHPGPAKASRSVDLGIDVSILEFMFDTTRMLTNMIFSGAKKRFSNIKIISTHGGGTIPYLAGRSHHAECAVCCEPTLTALRVYIVMCIANALTMSYSSSSPPRVQIEFSRTKEIR
jgi:predicted TIM-barrel fold metal-dependent hydrolase